MLRLFKIAILLLMIAVTPVWAAGADANWQRVDVALNLFKKTCFPQIAQLSHLREQAKNAGFTSVGESQHSMLQLASKNLLKARKFMDGQTQIEIKSIDHSIYTKIVNDVHYYAIINSKNSLMGKLNDCHIYDFDLATVMDQPKFKLYYDSIIASYAFNGRYLSNFFWFYDNAESAKPKFSNIGMGRPKKDKGLTGLHLSIAGPAS